MTMYPEAGSAYAFGYCKYVRKQKLYKQPSVIIRTLHQYISDLQ